MQQHCVSRLLVGFLITFYLHASSQLTERPANIKIIWDLFIDSFSLKLSAPKLIISADVYRDTFSAAVVQTQLDTGVSRGDSILQVFIRVQNCESNDEALRKPYLFSQSVTRHVCDLASRTDAKPDIMQDLRSQFWDEDCFVGGSFA